MYGLIIFGILVIVGFLMCRNAKHNFPKKETEPSVAPVSLESPAPTKVMWEDEMAASLTALRRSVREKAKEEAQPLHNEIRDAEGRLKAILATAEKLGVSDSVTAIVDEMRHWDAWSKNPKFDLQKERFVKGLSYLGGKSVKEKSSNTNTNEFIFQDHKYRVSEASEQAAYEGKYWYADLLLETFDDNGWKTIFRADLKKDISEEYSVWSVFRVTLFEVGEWIHDIVMLNELFCVRRAQSSLIQKAEYILSKAKNI